MSDSIPSAHPGPDAVDQHRPANAEDRKAAAALSSLNTNEIGADSGTKPPSSADQEALGKAMSRLEIAAGQDTGKRTAEAQKESEVVRKKAVKVTSEDVNLLVEQLDLTKIKATELLKSNNGDAKQAIKAFITPAIGA
ncbi:hypothetical protein ETB97_002843 [Aspergillus alliaceus]|uniref:Nascent polypeptide-associated complex subunit alpha-like UBA domain-containing protein n=1 Tax=Petromyces alliaceus TaxID=209559 RepID=A0A5N6GEN3_PETAA|nr:uncharacterized protein BDW43DRAFT_305403 [Aspergillus alliaceus]KAB8239630.1 hypothetical protein BDW43DRAFT_305403 [Aspergillus alliaceus]KAE8394728.1 hypothetical protein BDV23DRAFT_135608 [Aspergillus alliaceus]KAF5859443.1 hypothetical protein ETB97_002843 [Aspergillus burnettii]